MRGISPPDLDAERATQWGILHADDLLASVLQQLPRTILSFGLGVLSFRLASAQRLVRLPFVGTAILLLLSFCTPSSWTAVELLGIIAIFPILIATSSPKLSRTGSLVCAWLGRISYPVYATHWTVFAALKATGLREIAGHQSVAGALYVVVAIAFAWVIVALFDEPIRAMLTRRFVSNGAVSGLRAQGRTG